MCVFRLEWENGNQPTVEVHIIIGTDVHEFKYDLGTIVQAMARVIGGITRGICDCCYNTGPKREYKLPLFVSQGYWSCVC